MLTSAVLICGWEPSNYWQECGQADGVVVEAV
jgi:hypothetical protein